MTIKTYSAFTYGHTITIDNQLIPFSENGVDEILATIPVGSYTLSDFAIAVSSAMTNFGSQTYTVSLDRSTRLLTISAPSNFWLYVTSSSVSNVSAYPLMGFSTERSNILTADGDSASGDIFEPQFYLQKYVDFDDFQSSNNVTVNETASGKVEVIKYGNINFMECNITLQTNIAQGKDSVIKNKSGYSDLLLFMQYATTKQPMEFIPNIDDMNTFTDCILEKTGSDSTGTGFKLKELYSRGFADWWETGIITFRKVI